MSTGMPDEHRQQTASTRRSEICGGRLLLADGCQPTETRNQAGAASTTPKVPMSAAAPPLSLFHLPSLPLVDTQLSASAHHTFLLRGRSNKRPLHVSIQTEHIQAGGVYRAQRLDGCASKKSKARSWTDLKKLAPEGRRSLTGNE